MSTDSKATVRDGPSSKLWDIARYLNWVFRKMRYSGIRCWLCNSFPLEHHRRSQITNIGLKMFLLLLEPEKGPSMRLLYGISAMYFLVIDCRKHWAFLLVDWLMLPIPVVDTKRAELYAFSFHCIKCRSIQSKYMYIIWLSLWESLEATLYISESWWVIRP